MTTFVFANNIDTTLASSISSSATTITLSSGTNLPVLTAGQTFVVTLNDAATQQVFEVMYATAISGTTLTVSRAQEGTTAQAWAAGDYVFSGPTAGQMRAFYQGQSVGQGSVTSVGMSMPSGFSVSGSPITVAGTLSVTFASQNAGLFLATPVTGGAAGAATWRSMAAADVDGALGYTAANAANVVNTFNGRLGAVTLSSTDVDGALGYTAANDANVVHITGTETITGAKTFSSPTVSSASFGGPGTNPSSMAFVGAGAYGGGFGMVSSGVGCGIFMESVGGKGQLNFATGTATSIINVGSLDGSGNFATSGSVTCTTMNATSSDRRLKRDIKPFEPRPLHRTVPFVSYTLKESGWQGLGSTAQKMQKTAPEHVGEFDWHGKKRLSLNYAGAAYEQAMWAGQEIDCLTKLIATQLKRIQKLETRLAALERRV